MPAPTHTDRLAEFHRLARQLGRPGHDGQAAGCAACATADQAGREAARRHRAHLRALALRVRTLR